MKNIFVIFILSIMLFMLGCVTTGLSTTRSTTAFSTTIPIEHLETQEELLVVLSDYRTQFASFAYSSPEDQATLPSNVNPSFLVDGIVIDRDTLPNQIDPGDLRLTFDAGRIFATGSILAEVHNVIASCASFLESAYCTVMDGEKENRIQVHRLGDTLTIDWYAFDPESNPGYPSPQVESYRIVFSIVDGLLQLAMARDLIRIPGEIIEHYRWYDRFDEDGGCLNIFLDMMHDETFYFHSYDVTTGEIYTINADRLLEMQTSITSLTTNITFGATYDPSGTQTTVSVSYLYRSTVLSYTEWTDQSPHQARVGWNLYLVSGWNRAKLNASGSDLIYGGDEAVLTDFWIRIDPDPNAPSAMAYLSLPAADIDETVLDLSDFGLYFDAVNCTDLFYNVAYAPTDLLHAYARYGFSGDAADHREMLLSLFTVNVDQDLIDGFFE